MIEQKYNIPGHKDLQDFWRNNDSLLHFPNTNGTALDAIANNMLTLWWQVHFWTRTSTSTEENPVLHKLKRKMHQITCWKPFWPKDGSRVNFNFVSTPRNKKEKDNHGHYFHLAQKRNPPNWNKNTRFQLHVSTTTFQLVSVNSCVQWIRGTC